VLLTRNSGTSYLFGAAAEKVVLGWDQQVSDEDSLIGRPQVPNGEMQAKSGDTIPISLATYQVSNSGGHHTYFALLQIGYQVPKGGTGLFQGHRDYSLTCKMAVAVSMNLCAEAITALPEIRGHHTYFACCKSGIMLPECRNNTGPDCALHSRRSQERLGKSMSVPVLTASKSSVTL